MAKPTRQKMAVFARSLGSCSKQATVYGRCVASKVEDVQKGLCQMEFNAFKECVQKAVRRAW